MGLCWLNSVGIDFEALLDCTVSNDWSDSVVGDVVPLNVPDADGELCVSEVIAGFKLNTW